MANFKLEKLKMLAATYTAVYAATVVNHQKDDDLAACEYATSDAKDAVRSMADFFEEMERL